MAQSTSSSRAQASSLMYHDVVDPGDYDASGSSIVGANAYKMDRADFARHLDAIAKAVNPASVVKADEFDGWGKSRPVFITFDDGGASAYTPIAGMLEQHGWRGHFFITTDWIGTRGFVTAEQIRELHARGHVVGSHSCSHPIRMAACTRAQLEREWSESVRILSEIIGRPATVASVPGGYFSRAVAETASGAGIRRLFTSEPTATATSIDGCMILGRYVLKRGMPARIAAGFAAGRFGTCARQSLEWKLKHIAKRVSAPVYLKIRAALMGGR